MTFISENNLAALIGTSNRTVQTWGKNGLYPLHQQNGVSGFDMNELKSIPEVEAMLQSNWEAESAVTPVRQFNSIELFAGGGGLALGRCQAGFCLPKTIEILARELNTDITDITKNGNDSNG